MAGKAIVCVVKVRWGHGCEGRYQDDLASYKNIQVWRDEVFYCLVLQVVVFALTHVILFGQGSWANFLDLTIY